MELKCGWCRWTPPAVSGFNCTFMELKYDEYRGSKGEASCVLIVPLWNWNLAAECIISWLSVLYALNGRKAAKWILCRYEKCEI